VFRSTSVIRTLLATALLLGQAALLALAQPAGQRWDVLNKNATGGFIVSLAADLHGNIWIGTEDKGVFRFDPRPDERRGSAPPWTQFNAKNGLGDDNAYAIACDKLGRVWVGTLNKGVSVFTGERGESSPRCWKNYDVLDGPIGERIFAITTCPTDGDVWLATSAGLTRYSLKNDAWSYYTRADGLPEDQANAVAFDSQGNIYVGTQCHGIATAKSADDYKKWTAVAGPAYLPVTPTGAGLPTSLINALVVARDGTIYAGTTAGLAWSKDKGKTWQYVRGRDYDDKVKGRWGGPPQGWKAASQQVMDTLLPEDYVTCLAEDASGLLWVGFRQQGYVALDPKTLRPAFSGSKKTDGLPDDYVFTILPTSDFRPWLGTYGGGVGQAKQPLKGPGAKDVAAVKPPDKPAPFPTPAKPPKVAELQAMLKQVQGLPTTKLVAAYLDEDWTTQGDWVGRYGRQQAMLCAMASPLDHDYGWDERFIIKGAIGLNRTKDDAIRRWVHWAKTDNPRSMYTPVSGYRRQAEWDDHGEAYPLSHEGPDLWAAVTVPEGLYRLSLYFFNKDGHDGMNRCRDYLIQLMRYTTDLRQAEAAPSLASCRVRHFWGGVYPKFVITGPATYWVKIAKNGSYNTICSALLVDRLRGKEEWWDQGALPFMTNVIYRAPECPEDGPPVNKAAEAARLLWEGLDDAYERQPAISSQWRSRLFAYRAAAAENAPAWLLGNWRWKLPLWTPTDRKGLDEALAKARVERARIKELNSSKP
jgi:hypothetical protein